MEGLAKEISDEQRGAINATGRSTPAFFRYVKEREERKHKLIGAYMEAQDKELFVNGDVRMDSVLLLEQIVKSGNEDLKTIWNMIPSFGNVIAQQAMDRLHSIQKQIKEASKLKDELEGNNLAPILPSTPPSFTEGDLNLPSITPLGHLSSTKPAQSCAQDSSDITSDGEMPDYT